MISSVSIARADQRETIALFDGATLKGWTDVNGNPAPGNWSVEDGMIVRSKGGGSLYTREQFGDFDLSFEWKIAPRGNSGVKYRIAFFERGVFGRPGWLGFEYQIYDDAHRTVRNGTGALYDLYPATKDAPKRPAGEFNTSRIVARGPRLQHWLNGKLVVDAKIGSDDWRRRLAESKFAPIEAFSHTPAGRIELQDHDSKVWFRNIVITPLDK